MVLLILILIPVLTIIISLTRSNRVWENVALLSSAVEVVLALYLATHPGSWEVAPYAFLSPFSVYLLMTTSVIGLVSSIYSIGYLRSEIERRFISNGQAHQFWLLLRGLLLLLYLAVVAANPLFTWIFLEATSLGIAYLVSFYGKRSDVEAAWKYLIINSVGLLLAFFGIQFFMAGVHVGSHITWPELLQAGSKVTSATVKISFVFILVGFGTKIGWAPLHAWRPDAYSKAPTPIVALLSAAVLNVAFLPVLRFKKVADLSLGSGFSNGLLIFFGLFSIFMAALAILNQKNYKRLLAYSSIEHAGILALGFGFGGLATVAALLHMVYHSLAKSILFFAAGNTFLKFGSPKISKIRGLAELMPITTFLWTIGLVAVLGLPPFGMFLTELSILAEGVRTHLWTTLAAVLGLGLVFVGVIRQFSSMMTNHPEDDSIAKGEINAWTLAAPAICLVLLLVLSLYQPAFWQSLLQGSLSLY